METPEEKKPAPKMDRKLVASKQPWEPQHIADKFDIPVGAVREAMDEAGKNGKPSRSRAKIYAKLREKNFVVSK